MKECDYDLVLDPGPEDLAQIDRGLHEFNLAHLGEHVIYDYHRLAIVARDGDERVVGGIHGELVWEWLYIQSLWVDPAWRGQGIGSQLVAQIEAAAVSKGFCDSHLETTDFQALDFYLRQGYQVFGELEGKPAGVTWYYLKKHLPGAVSRIRAWTERELKCN
ncbi:MAG: GNAT family N-acetyltransferase [Anaerolineae bacterium]